MDNQSTIIKVSNPSLKTYNDLHKLYSETLKCPCSSVTIGYERFVSLSPRLHEICSSAFVDEVWISILMSITYQMIPFDWLNHGGSQFQLLSELCQLANETINDAVHRFVEQSLISSTIVNQIDLKEQMNTSLEQLFSSTIVYFAQLIDIVHLHFQVDQPFVQSGHGLENPVTNGFILNNPDLHVRCLIEKESFEIDLYFVFSFDLDQLRPMMFILNLLIVFVQRINIVKVNMLFMKLMNMDLIILIHVLFMFSQGLFQVVI